MTADENKKLATRYLQAWASRDLSEFEALLSPDFRDVMMGVPRGRDELLRDAADASLRDISQEIEAILAEDDKVAVKYTTSATLAATGRPLKFTGMFILTIAHGKVTGGWGQFDRFGIRSQVSGSDARLPVAQYPRRAEGSLPSADESRELCRRYLQAWTTGDVTSFESLLSGDFVDYMMGQPRTRAELLQQAANPFLTQLNPRVDVLIAEGDLAALHYTMQATQKATGKAVTWTGMFIVTTAKGKVTGGWGERDTVTIREQMALA